ncbi:MAG: hypothetical protein C4533_02415 [Candidatus Omnitrophota bacterium]|jgi:hypothetical protein|nr:MAG: hypothetical protein C4533_02415 [Candidatus Omnitrophota bacterium]
MKKITLLTAILLLAFFIAQASAEAISFSVSCTIPAIPGVNAPADNTSTNNQTPSQHADVKTDVKEVKAELKPEIIQQVSERLIMADNAAMVSLKTVYNR